MRGRINTYTPAFANSSRAVRKRFVLDIQGIFSLGIGHMWPLELPSYCGDETLGIRAKLRCMHGSAVLKRLRCPVDIVGNLTYTASQSVEFPFTALVSRRCMSMRAGQGFFYREITGFLSSV